MRRSLGTVVLDLDGVVYLDSQGIDGAGEALQELHDAGFSLRYATNNSGKSRDDVARHIEERTGFVADPLDAVTSSRVTAGYVSERYATAFVVGPEALTDELMAHDVDLVPAAEADAVVVGLDRHLTYDTIDIASRAIREGAAFVASNADSTYPTPTGLAPGAGTIVAAIATASGVEPVVCGKPTPVFAHELARLVEPGPAWMVGDRIETDIALGVAMGWTTVLVLSGVSTHEHARTAEPGPDHTIGSIADLPQIVHGSVAGTPSEG